MPRRRAPGSLRVAIDGMPLIGERTGVGHVTAGLVEALSRRDDLDLVVFAVTRNGRRRLAGLVPEGVRVGTSQLPARFVRPVWERIPWPKAEHWTGRVDVLHATNFVAPPARAPVVITVHDITFVHHPELVSEDTRRFFEPLIRRSIERGASIHVVSDFVGAEVREAFGIEPERVHRVYPGIAATAGGSATEGRRIAGAERYLLGLGQLEPRKNFPVLVEAFDRLAATHPDLHLVIAGPDGWGRIAFDDACARATHGDRARWIGYVGDDERRHVLAGAAVFAYPSLYEGFGHPPLEAMAAGIPVVATTAGAVAEVVGDAALLADPHDVDAFAEQLARVLDDDEERARLVERGRARAAEFTWEAAAGRFVEMYRTLASG